MSLPRRQVEELRVRYKLEPTLRDVYVEGPKDKRVLDAFFTQTAAHRAVVYTIETIDVPMALLVGQGLTAGNRQRVVALAMSLYSSDLPDSQTFTGLIDCDLDNLLGQAPPCPYLLLTDYACIEGYLWNEAALTRLLMYTVGGSSRDMSEAYASICSCIRKLFLFRAAARRMELAISWVSLKSLTSAAGTQIVIDYEELANRSLVASGLNGQFDDLVSTVDALNESLGHDCRHSMNWHDALQLLPIAIRRLRPSIASPKAEAIDLSIFMSAEWVQLPNEPMLSKLLLRVTT